MQSKVHRRQPVATNWKLDLPSASPLVAILVRRKILC